MSEPGDRRSASPITPQQADDVFHANSDGETSSDNNRPRVLLENTENGVNVEDSIIQQLAIVEQKAQEAMEMAAQAIQVQQEFSDRIAVLMGPLVELLQYFSDTVVVARPEADIEQRCHSLLSAIRVACPVLHTLSFVSTQGTQHSANKQVFNDNDVEFDQEVVVNTTENDHVETDIGGAVKIGDDALGTGKLGADKVVTHSESESGLSANRSESPSSIVGIRVGESTGVSGRRDTTSPSSSGRQNMVAHPPQGGTSPGSSCWRKDPENPGDGFPESAQGSSSIQENTKKLTQAVLSEEVQVVQAKEQNQSEKTEKLVSPNQTVPKSHAMQTRAKSKSNIGGKGPSVMTMSFRAGKLESFDGSANMHFSDWLRSFTDHINVSNREEVDDSAKVSLLLTYLKDSARERASEVLSGIPKEKQTFETVSNKLKETFERKAYKQKAREELSCAKQSSREDVESFYYRVLRLIKIAHGDANSAIAKDAFRDAFINGLPSKSKMLVFAKDPETAQDALDVAIRLANFEDSPTKKSLESAKKHDRTFGGGDRTHRPFTGAPNREFHPSVQMNYPSRGQSRFNPSYRNNNSSRGGFNNPRGGYNNYRGGYNGNGGGYSQNLNQTLPAQGTKTCYHCGHVGHISRLCFSKWGVDEAHRRMHVNNEDSMGVPLSGRSSRTGRRGSHRGRSRDSHNQTFQPSSNHQQKRPQVQVIQSGSSESEYQDLRAENEDLRARNNELIQQRFGATHHYGAQVIEVSPKRINGSRPVISNVDHDEEYISLQIPIKVNKLMFAALVDTGASITVASDKLCKILGIKRLVQVGAGAAFGLGNNEVIVAGTAVVEFIIGSNKINHRVHFIDGQCTPKVAHEYDFIIGNDLLKQMPKLSLDYQNSSIHIGNDTFSMGIPKKNQKSSKSSVYQVFVAKDTTILPKSKVFNACQLLYKPITSECSFAIHLQVMLLSRKELNLPKGLSSRVTPEIYSVFDEGSDDGVAGVFTIQHEQEIDPEFVVDLSKCEGITTEEKSRLQNLLDQYSDVFSKNQYDLGSSKTDPVHIYTTTEVPVRGRPYRVPVKFQADLEKQINGLLKSGRITESNTPWISPIVIVKKKNGSLRVCLDFRKLNEVTIPDNYPLPRIDAIVERVGHMKFFSSLDMANGYLQLRLDDESSYKCGFTTENRVYAYSHLPFGLKSAASYFQRALKTVLDGMDHEVMLYIDDVLIISKTYDEHLDTLERVLQRFRQYNLKVSPKKCDLVRKSIVFLGHQINEENYEPNKSNVSAIVNMPTPSNINELRRFIGMTGFFRRFVKDYSEIVQPLNKLTHKNTPFVWTQVHQDAVQKLKTILTSKPVLCYPDYNKEFHCYTDASGVAQGAVLMQTKPGDESKMQAIAYASRTLSQPETRRAAIHNELGGIIFALRAFKVYIYGSKVVIHTDHRPLIFLMKRHKVNDVLARWLVELQQYNIDIVHIDGKRNTIADCLSRPPDDGKPLADKDLEDIIEFPYCLTIHGVKRLFRPRGKNAVIDLITEQRMDKELSVLRKFLEDPSNDSIKVPTKFRDIMDRLEFTSQELLVVHYNGGRRILVPEKIKRMLFDSFHENMSSGGHLCWRKSLEKAQRRYFWPGMRGDFLEWTNQCLPCQKRRNLAPANRELQSVVCTSAVFEKVGLDLTGPLRESTRGNRYYLNIVCWFSKFVISVAIPDATTETVSRAFVEQCILKYGTPAEIITDNARNFTSGDFKDIGEQMGLKHHFSIPHHSRGNGATERTFRTFHNMVSKYVNKTHTDWDSVLPCVTSAYNTAVHSTTGESPFFLVYGRDPVFPIDRILDKEIVDVDKVNPDTWKEHLLTTLSHAWKEAAEQSYRSQLQHQEFANRGAKVKDIRIGDRVLIRNYDSKVKQSRKLVHNWLDGYRVTAVRGTEAEVTNIRDPRKVKRMHFNQIKHQYSTKEEEKLRDLRRDAPPKEDSEEDFDESKEDSLVKSPINEEAKSDLEEDISFVQEINNTSKDSDELLAKRLTANKEEEKKLTGSPKDNKKKLTKKQIEKNNQINDPDQLTKKKINKMSSNKKNEEKEKKNKKKEEIVKKKNEDKKEKETNKLSNKEEFSQGATTRSSQGRTATRRYPARIHNKPAKYTQ
ncbi:hypothetical protein CAEBREN_31619 [Caenorhabditis brenneri]|uniref:RNA-directed DNA polymerase n=1 Tax=Caenorhabditis brenneri TaxID=135651 RepID=G0NID8_CAEBE|nr:hypothetical protein CAEBREN_31619 [Caenorhabditis brenneri]